jgi:hypothetical protein
MSIYTEPTDLLLLDPAHLASHLRAVVENGMPRWRRSKALRCVRAMESDGSPEAVIDVK